jgi:hypothetical protein
MGEVVDEEYYKIVQFHLLYQVTAVGHIVQIFFFLLVRKAADFVFVFVELTPVSIDRGFGRGRSVVTIGILFHCVNFVSIKKDCNRFGSLLQTQQFDRYLDSPVLLSNAKVATGFIVFSFLFAFLDVSICSN